MEFESKDIILAFLDKKGQATTKEIIQEVKKHIPDCEDRVLTGLAMLKRQGIVEKTISKELKSSIWKKT